jgi:hypothetical protein
VATFKVNDLSGAIKDFNGLSKSIFDNVATLQRSTLAIKQQDAVTQFNLSALQAQLGPLQQELQNLGTLGVA